MSALEQLRSATTRTELARLLDVNPSSLTHAIYKMDPKDRYRAFTIPKKHGGNRHISAPHPKLKFLQRRLSDVLHKCLQEIEDQNPSRQLAAHGFFKGRGIITNAAPHVGRRFVFNIDLENFFDEINFGRVRGYFLKDRHFRLDPTVATTIAQIACFENKLPQGSPASPIISNLILRILDTRLASLAASHGVFYTRYADDLTFSTSKRRFPSRIARRKLLGKSTWLPGRELLREIKLAGFRINSTKTRMQLAGSRQEAAGLVVNSKINVNRDYYRLTRSMCNSLFCRGYYHIPDNTPVDRKPENGTRTLAPLEGRLSFLYYIKGRRDLSDDELRNRKDRNEFSNPRALESLYHKYLMYKYCGGNLRPTIITEGKTDIVYLKCALRARQTHFPSLFETIDGKDISRLSFLQPSRTNLELLNVGSGSGGFPYFISTYVKHMKRLPAASMQSPVIIFVDNDSGGRATMKAASKVSGSSIGISTAGVWYHIVKNLYLLKTPVGLGGHPDTCTEDLFPADVLATPISGKSFNRNSDTDTKTEYGKHVFSDRVVRKIRDASKFAAFDELLKGIEEIMSDYDSKKPLP
jgi:RNA-directed DNA polymerase